MSNELESKVNRIEIGSRGNFTNSHPHTVAQIMTDRVPSVSSLSSSSSSSSSTRRSLSVLFPPIGSSASAAAAGGSVTATNGTSNSNNNSSSSQISVDIRATGGSEETLTSDPIPPIMPPIATPSSIGASSSLLAASAYKSHPSNLLNTLHPGALPSSIQVDRSQQGEKRRQYQQLLAQQQQHAPAMFQPTSAKDDTLGQDDNSAAPSLPRETDEKASSGPAIFDVTSGLRIPTPLPDHHAPAATSTSFHHHPGRIDLLLPSSHPPHLHPHPPTGSQSARSIHHPPSSLASITQDTNERVANFLRHYEGHRRSDSFADLSTSGSASPSKSMKSHRLILSHMTHMTRQQLEEEKEISRLLTNWHPVKSAKTFSSLSSKIRHIISERVALFDGHFHAKTLVEDAGFVSDELEKKRLQYYKIMVPSTSSSLKVDLDVTEGRVDMFISASEPIHHPSLGKSGVKVGVPIYAPWSLKANVGHHTLTVHGSDQNWRGGGEYFYITLYAVQASSVTIKASIGVGAAKGKTSGINSSISGVNTNANSSMPALSDDLLSPSSSNKTSLAARQSPTSISSTSSTSRHLSSSSPSSSSSAAVSSSSSNSNSSLAPTNSRNIRRALEERLRSLSENPKALREFMQRVNLTKRHGIAASASHRSTNLMPPAHLTDRALQKLNDEQEAAEQLATAAANAYEPRDHGRGHALTHADARSSPKSVTRRRTLASNRPQPLTPHSLDHIVHIGAIDGVASTFYQYAAELQPPVLDARGYIRLELDLEYDASNSYDASSPTSPPMSPIVVSPPESPRFERRESISRTLQTLIARVCKRMKIRSLQLASMVDPASEEEALFLQRCLTIYQGHLTEIEHCLEALATGDASQAHLAKYLGAMPTKNFLLANAYDATDNRSHMPARADRRRADWHADHRSKMESADVRRDRCERERRDKTLEMIEHKERQRAEAVARRQAEAARLALGQFQRQWLQHLALTLRHAWLREARLNLRPMRIEAFRKNRAARRIQLFIRMTLAVKRKTRATLHFQAFRSMVLLMSSNYAVVKRDRAANCLKLFLEQKQGVDSVSRLIKNFRRRVGICQRASLAWIATRRAKLTAWRIQYDRTVSRLHNRMLAQDTTTRERLLDQLFHRLKRRAMEEYEDYLQALHAYHIRLDEETQKQRIISDHVLELLAWPRRPRVPVILSEEDLNTLIEDALVATRDQARRNLQTTTEQQELSEAAAAAAASSSPPDHSYLRTPTQHTRRDAGSHSASRTKKSRAGTTSNAPHHANEDHHPHHLQVDEPYKRSRSNSIVGAGSILHNKT